MLNVELSRSQLLFIAIVITIAPLLAGLLIWRGATRAGAIMLALSMAGSLVFGVYHHFVLISPDHVSHLPGIPGTIPVIMFQVTAVLLALLEGLGVIAGIMALKSDASTAG
jgi:Na+/proline symporter